MTHQTKFARLALLTATAMMAWYVAAKTLRDSFFLSVFDPKALPAMVGAAAVCSVILAALSTKLLRAFGPFRVIPKLYLASAVLHGVEYALLSRFPRPVAVVIYLHVVAFGLVLLSGFWAIANEHFDPRCARKQFGRIAAFGTLGGLLGGLAAERVATLFSTAALLPLLLVLQFGVALILMQFSPPPRAKSFETPPLMETLARAPYLFGLAGLLLLVSMSAAMLDFLFKSHAVSHFGRGPALSRFFAFFYMATSVASFAAQAGLSPFWLQRFKLARTVATLPVGVAGASLLALFSPVAFVLTAARGFELVLRGSLFRSGYELFYTPMPQGEKRSAKSLIDVAADRIGDGLGAAAVGLLLWLPARTSTYGILVSTALVSSIATWLSFRLDRDYSRVLEKKLSQHDVDLQDVPVEDPIQSSAVMTGPLSMLRGLSTSARQDSPTTSLDPVLQQLAELRCGESRRVKVCLDRLERFDQLLVPQLILLVGRDSVSRRAHMVLARRQFPIDGQLVDAFLDRSQDYAVRRRLPRLLATCESRRAWDGLLEGLQDPVFQIRARSARAMDTILQRHPEYRPEPSLVYDIVAKNLSAGRAERHQSGDNLGSNGVAKLDATMITHLMTLLGLVLPREAVQTALRALLAEDAHLRGLALEYLESAVPRNLREPLCEYLEARPSEIGETSPEQSLARLLDESPSILARLEESGREKA